MTHDRLIHPAELAEEAGDCSDNPSWTRQLIDAADAARRMAAGEARIDQDENLHTRLDETHEPMGR